MHTAENFWQELIKVSVFSFARSEDRIIAAFLPAAKRHGPEVGFVGVVIGVVRSRLSQTKPNHPNKPNQFQNWFQNQFVFNSNLTWRLVSVERSFTCSG